MKLYARLAALAATLFLCAFAQAAPQSAPVSGALTLTPVSPPPALQGLVPHNTSKDYVLYGPPPNTYQGHLAVWDIASRKVVLLIDFKGVGGSFYSAFSPDGRYLAISAGMNIGGQLWDIPAARLVTKDLPHDYTTGLRFTPDSSKLAVAIHSVGPQGPGYIELIDSNTGRKAGRYTIGQFDHQWQDNQLWGFAISPDSKRLAISSQRNIYRWDLVTGKPLGPPWPDLGSLTLAFSPDGQRLAVAQRLNNGAQVLVLDAVSGAPLGMPLKLDGPFAQINGMAYSPDGRYLYTVHLFRDVNVWDVAAAQRVAQASVDERNILYYPVFSRDMRQLYINNRAWDVSLRTDALPQLAPAPQPEARVAIPAGDDFRDFASDIQIGPYGGFTSAAAIAPGGEIAFGMLQTLQIVRDGKITAADLTIDPPLTEDMQGYNFVNHVTLSPDGRYAAAQPDGRVINIVDAQQGKVVDVLEHSARYECPLFLHDGSLALGTSRGVLLLSPGSWKAKRTVPLRTFKTACPIAVGNATSRFLVNGGPGNLLVVQNGLSVSLQLKKDNPTAATFNPDDKEVAIGFDTGKVRIYDTRTGKQAGKTLQLHTTRIGILGYSPDGRLLATGTGDGALHLWDLRSGQPYTYPLTSSQSPVLALRFDATGTHLQTLDSGGVWRRWTIPAAK